MSVQFNRSSSVNANGANPVSGVTIDVGNQDLEINLAVAPNLTGSALGIAFNGATLQSLQLVASQPIRLDFNAAALNEIEAVVLTGSPTGGTFTLTFGGQTTAGIAWNALAGAVQSALTALSSIGLGNMICTGGPLPGTIVNCQFAGTLGFAPQALFTFSGASLTGGSSPNVSVTEVTHGVTPFKSISLIAGAAFAWSASEGYYGNPLNTNITNVYVTSTTACSLKGKVLYN